MPPRIARLAGLGAYAASLGLLLVFALLLFGTRGSRFAGMDATMRMMTWIAVGGVIVALVLVHVMFARKLLDVARDLRDVP